MIHPDTLAYTVHYTERWEGNADLGSPGSRSLRTTTVLIGGPEHAPYRTSFRDLVKIIAIARGTTEDNILIHALSLDVERSDPSAL